MIRSCWDLSIRLSELENRPSVFFLVASHDIIYEGVGRKHVGKQTFVKPDFQERKRFFSFSPRLTQGPDCFRSVYPSSLSLKKWKRRPSVQSVCCVNCPVPPEQWKATTSLANVN